VDVDAPSTSAIQEAHLVAVHALCAAVERHLPGRRGLAIPAPADLARLR
jgi:hypothetical protein